MKTFCEIVKEARKKSGLTQFEFGSEIGVSWITIWRWEHDEHLPKENVIDFWKKKVQSV